MESVLGLGPDQGGNPTDMRMLVLETAVAVIAARLPRNDFEELVSVLVMIARGPDAFRDEEELSAEITNLTDAAAHATALLERISKVRRSERR
ncbi:hypothetical protein [Muricoccus radiodurans]|uniref:hypothetical protein n=1 Tax=Muricoccus radiodurans TaxID=2231721 RepID=UPI003CE6D13B